MKEYTNYRNSENLYIWAKESYNDMLELYEKKSGMELSVELRK